MRKITYPKDPSLLTRKSKMVLKMILLMMNMKVEKKITRKKQGAISN